MIATSDLTFSYTSSNLFTFPNVKCEPGEQLLILGDSGSGKTTLLHLICGLLKPKNGIIEIDGVKVSSLNDRALDKFRGKNIGVIFQSFNLIQTILQ